MLTAWLCTPRNLDDLAIGWLIGEGHLLRDEAIFPLEVGADGLSVRLTDGRPRSSIGGDIPPLRPIPHSRLERLVEGDTLRRRFERMFSEGELREETGGIHTGALVVADSVHTVREDVSRHCVIDKLVGAARQAGIDPGEAEILLSGRVSGSIAAKLARAGIPIIATMSIPTTLAATIAGQAGVTIIGRARSPKPYLYSATV